MGHGTKISGVQRDITGGMTLVNGIQRKITKGLTLVGGVQREISFSKTFTVTLTGTGWSKLYGFIKINGVEYASGNNYTVEVPEGSEIVCTVYNVVAGSTLTIKLNGKGVATPESISASYTYCNYTHIVDSNLVIKCINDGSMACKMEITTS